MPSRPHSQNLFGLQCLSSAHPAVRRLKRRLPGNPLHGNKLWNASVLLMDYLQQQPLPEGSRVLELGCGWGLAGIFCAKFQQAAVTALDADASVFPLLALQAEHNGVKINTRSRDFSSLTKAELADFDVLIGSDICFWDAMAEDVYALINRALDAGIKSIIISDPNRPPFLAVAEACIEEHFAELLPWHCRLEPRNYRGSILLIENA